MNEATTLLPVAGQQLEVQHITVGKGGDTLVLLHEALGSVSHWRDFPRQLANRCAMDVLVYSRLGHGQSDGPPASRSRSYFQQQALEVLPALLAHFAVTQPILLGHSEGAAMALLFAVEYPERTRALILESPILLMEPAAAAGMALAEQAWQETDLRERLARHHRDPAAVFAAWLSIRGSDTMLSLPLEANLPPVHCPLLMIQGEHDEYATMLQADALRPLAPQMQLMRLQDSGHTPHREQSEIVLERIADFLAALPDRLGSTA